MSNDHNPPAFPRAAAPRPNGGALIHRGTEGMTLRDYFAAAALQQLARHYNSLAGPSGFGSAPDIARDCYAIADEMLAVRQENN